MPQQFDGCKLCGNEMDRNETALLRFACSHTCHLACYRAWFRRHKNDYVLRRRYHTYICFVDPCMALAFPGRIANDDDAAAWCDLVKPCKAAEPAEILDSSADEEEPF